MDSYFFVPASKLRNVESLKQRQVGQIIIDLEDAVKVSDRLELLSTLIEEASSFLDCYIRVPLFEFGKDQIDLSLISSLHQQGYNKFVFPKLNSLQDFEQVIRSLDQDLKIILLVESPDFFFDIQELLGKYRHLIAGIAIGSHDFMATIGGVHSLANLEYIRQHLLYLARMARVEAIDIASMNLNDAEELKAEILDGFNKGYDAKFYIHPWQIEQKNSIAFYTLEEQELAIKITQSYEKAGAIGEFNPIVIDGLVIERPHLTRAQKIIKYMQHESK